MCVKRINMCMKEIACLSSIYHPAMPHSNTLAYLYERN